MAQNNTFRTKRRRWNGKRNALNALKRHALRTVIGVKFPLHEGTKSVIKRGEWL